MEKPLITIVMPTYNPRMDWFKEQLLSLENQTYPNLKLLVCDDCSPKVPVEDIKKMVLETIKSFPVEFYQNEHNMGSNKTFERLTSLVDSEFISYCDQDDVWCPEKLETLERHMEESNALLICSDMYVIDGEGKRTFNSITEARPFHIFRSGAGLAEKLLTANFVTGCTMMMRTKDAKAAIPFPDCFVHDHWLALYSASKGEILSLPDKLINYRIHGNNQTVVFNGVNDKESYTKIQVDAPLNKYQWLSENFDCSPELKAKINQCCQWQQARHDLLRGDGRARKTVWKYRHFEPKKSIFECVMAKMPNPIFMIAVNLYKRRCR